MRTQRVLLGELVVDREMPIELRAELPLAEVSEKAAVLKGRLVYLLDTRFRPSDPELPSRYGLTVEDVAESLHCRCRTVLRMIKSGQLHPLNDDDGEFYFDPAEIAGITHVPINPSLSRLVPPRK
jgi:hypothetical protein